MDGCRFSLHSRRVQLPEELTWNIIHTIPLEASGHVLISLLRFDPMIFGSITWIPRIPSEVDTLSETWIAVGLFAWVPSWDHVSCVLHNFMAYRAQVIVACQGVIGWRACLLHQRVETRNTQSEMIARVCDFCRFVPSTCYTQANVGKIGLAHVSRVQEQQTVFQLRLHQRESGILDRLRCLRLLVRCVEMGCVNNVKPLRLR